MVRGALPAAWLCGLALAFCVTSGCARFYHSDAADGGRDATVVDDRWRDQGVDQADAPRTEAPRTDAPRDLQRDLPSRDRAIDLGLLDRRSQDQRPPDQSRDLRSPDQGCREHAECSTHVCSGGICVLPKSCAELHSAAPQLVDGIYTLDPGSGSVHVYCDMQLGRELCSEAQGEHTGRARDTSSLDFVMTSVLNAATGTCEIWDLRDAVNGYPLAQLWKPAGATMDSCTALGLVSDQTLNICHYGSCKSGCSDCGYSVGYYRYGNTCSGCTVGAGNYDHWVEQGPMVDSYVLTTKTKTNTLLCNAR